MYATERGPGPPSGLPCPSNLYRFPPVRTGNTCLLCLAVLPPAERGWPFQTASLPQRRGKQAARVAMQLVCLARSFHWYENRAPSLENCTSQAAKLFVPPTAIDFFHSDWNVVIFYLRNKHAAGCLLISTTLSPEQLCSADGNSRPSRYVTSQCSGHGTPRHQILPKDILSRLKWLVIFLSCSTILAVQGLVWGQTCSLPHPL
jgi:hypothetical protein